MTIQDYKESNVKLREFILWSRRNYTRTPKKIFLKISVYAESLAFSFQKLGDSARRLGVQINETTNTINETHKQMKTPFLDQYQRMVIRQNSRHPYMASLALNKLVREFAKSTRIEKIVDWLNEKLK
jgi:hypothetical protein